jgi:hypothetical protein
MAFHMKGGEVIRKVSCSSFYPYQRNHAQHTEWKDGYEVTFGHGAKGKAFLSSVFKVLFALESRREAWGSGSGALVDNQAASDNL